MKWRTLLAVISNNCLVYELSPLSELTSGDGIFSKNHQKMRKMAQNGQNLGNRRKNQKSGFVALCQIIL